jgi:RNA polymerase sigma-70 factor (ECF subfamily)
MNIEDLYNRYGPMVIRRCKHLLKDEHEALDVAQDVFVRLLRRKEGVDDITYPSSMLYRIATNLCLNRIRDGRLEPQTVDDELLHQIASLDDDQAVHDARSVLRWLFGKHDEFSKAMAVLHFVDGMTLEEVAREPGYSVSGVRKRLRALRSTLEGMEDR